MKFHELLAGAAVGFLLTSGVAAQTTDLTPSPAAMARARHLVQTMHMQQTIDVMASEIMKTMFDDKLKNSSDIEKSKMDVMKSSLLDEFDKFVPSYINSATIVYANEFSEEELIEMDKFYSSPVGQSALAKIPQISAKLRPVMLGKLPDLVAGSFRQYCEKVSCTPAEHAVFDKAVGAMKQKYAAFAPH